MSFNNQNYIQEEFKLEELTQIPQQQQAKSFIQQQQQQPQINNKVYSMCPFCSAYQEECHVLPYQCFNQMCGRFIKQQPLIYYVYQCQFCFSQILHQQESTIICPQCQKVVYWSKQIEEKISRLSQQLIKK